MNKELDTQHAKMALLGEMFENVMHQFKQPLNAITTETTGIKFQHEMGMISDEDLYKSLDNITNRVEYLSNTIDDFRDFLKVNKEEESFDLKDCIIHSINIIDPVFKSKGVEIFTFFPDNSIILYGYPRDLAQVILNILNNAKDILLIKNYEEKIIKITLQEDEQNINIIIQDNGGGIPDDVIEYIFDDHFTTKEEHGGTGIGLNMSKNIIQEYFKGKLLASNDKFILNENSYYGAKFTIVLPK